MTAGAGFFNESVNKSCSIDKEMLHLPKAFETKKRSNSASELEGSYKFINGFFEESLLYNIGMYDSFENMTIYEQANTENSIDFIASSYALVSQIITESKSKPDLKFQLKAYEGKILCTIKSQIGSRKLQKKMEKNYFQPNELLAIYSEVSFKFYLINR